MSLAGLIPRADAVPADRVVDLIAARSTPQVTVLMPLFEQAAFVAEAVASVLEQEGVVAEVILSDDASGDGTLDLALDVVRDHRDTPHAVRVRRGTQRLRRAHVPALVAAATAPIVAQGHGDDVALPHRLRTLVAALADDTAILAGSTFITIGETGAELAPAADIGAGVRVMDLDEVLSPPRWLLGSVQAWRPARLSAFRPLDLDYAPLSHDRILPARAALLDGARAVGEPLLLRRVHDGSWSRHIVDPADRRTKRHGWALARVMMADVLLHDVDDATAAGALTPERARAARDRLGQLRTGWGDALRAHHAELLERGRRLAWLDEDGVDA